MNEQLELSLLILALCYVLLRARKRASKKYKAERIQFSAEIFQEECSHKESCYKERVGSLTTKLHHDKADEILSTKVKDRQELLDYLDKLN